MHWTGEHTILLTALIWLPAGLFGVLLTLVGCRKGYRLQAIGRWLMCIGGLIIVTPIAAPLLVNTVFPALEAVVKTMLAAIVLVLGSFLEGLAPIVLGPTGFIVVGLGHVGLGGYFVHRARRGKNPSRTTDGCSSL